MYLIRFGVTDLPEHDGQDTLPIVYRNNSVDLQNGSFDFDGNRQVLQSTNVARSAVIPVYDNIQTTLNALTTQANKGRAILRGKELDNTEYLTFAKVARMNINPNAEKYGCEEAIDIIFNQDYPFWLHGADVETFLDDGEIFDDYAWNFDGGNNDLSTIAATGSGTTVDTLTINNSGSAPCYRGYFILNFENDYDVNWVKIINHTNGLQMRYNLDIDGTGGIGSWTFDWLSKTLLTNTSDLDRTGLVLPNYQPDWFRLEIGNNDIEVQLNHNDDTDMNLYIFWSRHYTY